jgi:dolichyl-diphosphooligosaccharide--protein glycosyltransferase
MVPMIPMIALGLWSMVGPNRFVMYLAPLIGVGVGVLLEVLVNFAAKKTRFPQTIVPVGSVSLMFVLFFSTANYTAFYTHAQPSIPAAMVRAFLDIKRIVPEHSAMFTPYWEYGYALMEIGDFATYHDGGLQGGMRTTLISKAMLSDKQGDMVSLISYLEDYGFNRLGSKLRKDNLSADSLTKLVFGYPGEFKGENVYILYLEDMTWKLPAMSSIGTWDFKLKKSETMDYFSLHCTSMVDNLMRCSDGTIDLNRGFMNDGSIDLPLRAALFINDGYVIDQINYEREEGYYLQVLMKNGKAFQIFVADERLFRTNFNQQFLLGNYDPRYFEEVYNDFPVARLLKVRKKKSEEMLRQ